MTKEQLKAFLEALKTDQGLQEQLKAAADVDAVVAIAKAAGFVISADNLSNLNKLELSEEELEVVAGGVDTQGKDSCGPLFCTLACGDIGTLNNCQPN